MLSKINSFSGTLTLHKSDTEKIHNKEATSKGYALENKFELLEDFQSYKAALLHLKSDTEMATFSMVVESSAGDDVMDFPTERVLHTSRMKWGPQEYQTSNHPLKLMVS